MAATTMPRPGDIIGGTYVLGEPIGIGGMGVVFDAVQRSLDRPVAIKMPRDEVAELPLVRRRFRTEALASSRVSHRNLVSVIDFDDASPIPFLVMERVNGAPLGQLVFSGRMTFGLAAQMVDQILDALDEAHSAGIVHADVKSANVLVERLRDGRPWCRLIDFGLARFFDQRVDDARANGVSGTPQYMAPELISGQLPTFQSDLYAVGVILYELLTGSPPFMGDSAPAILVKQLEDDVVPPSKQLREPRMERDVDRIVLRALAKKASERFVSAKQFRAALDLARARASELQGATTLAAGLRPATQPTLPLVAASSADSPAVERARADVEATVTGGRAAQIATAYLALARALVDDRRLAAAAAELEQALRNFGGLDVVGVRWPILLSLAALYDGLRDPLRATRAARAAYDDAATSGSQIGQARAQQLFARLHGRAQVVERGHATGRDGDR